MSQIGKSDIIRAIFAAENLTGILLTQRMMDSAAAARRVPGFLDARLSGDRRLMPECCQLPRK